VLKVKSHANAQAGDPQIIQHQSSFVVGDFINYLRIYDERIKSNQVGNKDANPLAFVQHIKRGLLLEGNFPQQKLDDQCIFVWLLDETMAERVENLDSTAHNLKNLVL